MASVEVEGQASEERKNGQENEPLGRGDRQDRTGQDRTGGGERASGQKRKVIWQGVQQTTAGCNTSLHLSLRYNTAQLDMPGGADPGRVASCYQRLTSTPDPPTHQRPRPAQVGLAPSPSWPKGIG